MRATSAYLIADVRTKLLTKRRLQILIDLVAMGGLLLAIGLMTVVHFVPILLTSSGSLSVTASRLLNAGVTIAASLLSATVASRIQKALIRSLETPLRKIGEDLSHESQSDGSRELVAISKLESDWRGTLRIDGTLEKPRNLRNFLIFLLCGLITAAIVTDLTPSLTEKSIPYFPMIPDTSFGEYNNFNNRSCFGTLPANTNLSETRSIYWWNYPNNTKFYAAQDGDCPVSWVVPLSSNINIYKPDDYVYEISGVGVQRSAIGAPTGLMNGDAILNMSSQYGVDLVKTSQCAPVMVRNPVRCERGGRVEISGEHGMSIQAGTQVGGVPIADRTFNFSYVFENRWLNKDSVMLNRMWAASMSDGQLWVANDTAADPTGAIGPAVIVFAASNDPVGQNPFAQWLAAMVNEPDKAAGSQGNDTYAVTCTIDARDVFAYRAVTLNLHGAGERRTSNLAQYLSGSAEACTPRTPTITHKMVAAAAVAPYNLVYENTGGSGYFATLATLAGWKHNTTTMAFPESANPLEDVLGLVAALGVARMLTGESGGVAADFADGQPGARASVQVTRLGTEGREALFLLIPPVGSLVVLTVLFVLSFRPDWRPGGKAYAGLPESERPSRYAAESIYELVNLRSGMPAKKRKALHVRQDSDSTLRGSADEGPVEDKKAQTSIDVSQVSGELRE